MIKINEKNRKEIEKNLHLFYIKKIENISTHVGGNEKLSKLLGHSRNYMERILYRDNFKRIEKLYEEIVAYYGMDL
jgi:CRISPR/Cas system CSM-associated protein Csm2 small subunit